MKKFLLLLIPVIMLISGCKEYTVAEGIGIYDPHSDDAKQIEAELPEAYSIEYMVEIADVIAKAVVEDLTNVEVIMEEKEALGQRGVFASFKYSDVYYTWSRGESEGRGSLVYIDYTPDYQNVEDPGFEEDWEYIIFLKRFPPDAPHVFWNFYNYYLVNDYRTYMLKVTPENEAMVKELIDSIK